MDQHRWAKNHIGALSPKFLTHSNTSLSHQGPVKCRGDIDGTARLSAQWKAVNNKDTLTQERRKSDQRGGRQEDHL